MTIREISRILESEPRSSVESGIDELEGLIKQMDQRVKSLRYYDSGLIGEEELHRIVLLAELIYSHALNMSWTVPAHIKEGVVVADEYVSISRSYEIAGTKESGFLLKTPFLPRRYERRHMKQSRMIEMISRQMIVAYLKKIGEIMPVYERAKVVFTVCLGDDIPFAQAPDGDNLEIKYVLDALGGTLIQNDCLSETTILLTGERRAGASYTTICVTDVEKE